MFRFRKEASLNEAPAELITALQKQVWALQGKVGSIERNMATMSAVQNTIINHLKALRDGTPPPAIANPTAAPPPYHDAGMQTHGFMQDSTLIKEK